MLHEHNPKSPNGQRANLPNSLPEAKILKGLPLTAQQLSRAPYHPRSLNNLLPEAKILKGLPLTAAQLSRVLGGHAAGAEWHYEGYVIGNEAWIDRHDSRYDNGKILIRCRDWRGLLKRAADRLGTWQGIVRGHAPTLCAYVNAPVAKGHRSDVIYKIGMGLAEAGASDWEILIVLASSKCWQSKWGNNQRALKAEVARIMRKSHYGRH